MYDLTTRLSKAVADYFETINLRQEPFSLSRIEEVIAGVLATEGRAKLHVRMEELEANRKRQADFMERYKAQLK